MVLTLAECQKVGAGRQSQNFRIGKTPNKMSVFSNTYVFAIYLLPFVVIMKDKIYNIFDSAIPDTHNI